MKIALSIASVFFIFICCTKYSFDNYRKNPGIDLRFCNIKTWSDTQGEDARVNVFTYDEHQNPVSVKSNLSGTGNGNHYFTYDDKLRLVKYEFEFVRTKQFHYEGTSRTASGAQVIDLLGREFSETYTYDDKNRIIKSELHLVTTPFEGEIIPDEVREYIYMNDDLNSIVMNGQQVNPDVVYTNQPSVYMTNKVWMFINQNYSRHSIDAVETINRMGLPLKYEANHYEFPFLDIDGANSSITYNCR